MYSYDFNEMADLITALIGIHPKQAPNSLETFNATILSRKNIF